MPRSPDSSSPPRRRRDTAASPVSPVPPATAPVPARGAVVLPFPVRRARRGRAAGDAGMTTAEYAVGTVAACGFAALLYEVVTSDRVQGLVNDVITHALQSVT